MIKCKDCDNEYDDDASYCNTCDRKLNAVTNSSVKQVNTIELPKKFTFAMISSLGIVLSFFMPWMRFWQNKLSGYEIATNFDGAINALFLLPVIGLFIVVRILFGDRNPRFNIFMGLICLSVTISLIVLITKETGGSAKDVLGVLQFGYFLSVASAVGLIVSSFD